MELAAAADEGASVRLRIVDGEGRPGPSARRLRELDADPGIVAVIGGAFASVARPLTALEPPGRVPFLALSPLAFPRAITPGAGARRLHRLEALGQAAAAHAASRLEATRAGVIFRPTGEASAVLGESFSRDFAESGEIVWSVTPNEEGRVRPPPGPEEAIDVLWVAGPAVWAVEMVKASRGAREAAILLAAGWDAQGVEVLFEGDRVVHRVDFYSESDPRPIAVRFREACRAAGTDPSPAVALGWDAVLRVRDAIDRVGDERSRIDHVLGQGEATPGVTGRIGDGVAGAAGENPAVVALSRDGIRFLHRIDVPAAAGGDPREARPAGDSGPEESGMPRSP
jgi:hypothetical protein